MLDVAAQLFAERGFAGVTVDEVGAACGVSGPALYHHFAGKEAMLGEMLASVSGRLLARADEVAAGGMEPTGALDALIDAHVAFAVDHPELITVHFRDLVHAPADDQRRIRRLQRRYVERWVDVLTAVAPSLDLDRARATVQATFGLLNSTPWSRDLPAAATAELMRRLARHLLDPAALTDVVSGSRPPGEPPPAAGPELRPG
jgi:AcrR family transcriptional regulator